MLLEPLIEDFSEKYRFENLDVVFDNFLAIPASHEMEAKSFA